VLLRFLHRLLLWLPPELAHNIGVLGLRMLQASRLKKRLQRLPCTIDIRIRSVQKLRFCSRLGLAAGFDKDAQVFPALFSLGFGFIEVGTVTPRPQKGNPRPRLWRSANESLVNQLGFNSCGVEEFRNNIARHRVITENRPLFANIGKNKSTPSEIAVTDYAELFEKLRHLVDGFVVNVSSPNTPGLRDLQSESFLTEIARVAPVNLPVFVKLAPDLSNEEIKGLVGFINKEDRFSGVVLTNTSRALARSIAGREEGGLSGAPLFERSLECVSIAREILKDKILIGVGGVCNSYRATEMRNAGADLVEIYTSFAYGGPSLVRELAETLKS
jgi:dihydroorotate dehydrogenase